MSHRAAEAKFCKEERGGKISTTCMPNGSVYVSSGLLARTMVKLESYRKFITTMATPWRMIGCGYNRHVQDAYALEANSHGLHVPSKSLHQACADSPIPCAVQDSMVLHHS